MEITQELTPMILIEKSISNGDLKIEMLEKLMALQEIWDKKQAEKSFNSAFNKFQTDKPVLVKTKDVEYEKNGKKSKAFSFLPLDQLQKKVDPILSKYGLSYSWKQKNEDSKITITCILKHVNGHSESTELSGPTDNSGGKNIIQSIGSAVSYLKRYTLMNILGLSTGDDDGIASSLTKEEIRDAEKQKLIDLYFEKESKIDPKIKTRLDEVIANEEFFSYGKAIKTLESI